MVAKTSRGTAGGARGRRGGGRTVPGGRPAHLVRLPPRRPAPAGDRTGPFLRSAAAHAWRLIVVGIVVYGLFVVLGRFQTIAVALFLALVITSVLRPATDLLARLVPRPLAVALALVGSIVVLLGLLALVGDAVANESSTLADEFRNGVHRIEVWLQRPPFRLSRQKLSDLQDQIVHYFSAHRAGLLSSAVSGLGRAVEFVTGARSPSSPRSSSCTPASGCGPGRATRSCPAAHGRAGTGRAGRPGGPSPGTRGASSSWPPPTP